LLRQLAAPLRLAALLGEAAPRMAALDYLLAARPDPLLLLSHRGSILAASPAGERLLARQPGLARTLRAAFAGTQPRGPGTLALPGVEGLALVSPCPQRGRAGAYLVQIGAEALAGLGRITRRQAELLELLADGLSNKAIAERMAIAPATVKTMLERLYRRAGVQGRVQLLRWARGGGSGSAA
jgi:DNA-binding CsgD family transcriptional regulator